MCRVDHVSTQHNSAVITDGPRPVNLRTDLGELADLIELVFAANMDQGGRAAVREMRYLSHMGAGISLLPGINDLTHGINMGYVWLVDGKIVGNVSIYPTNRPHKNTWIVANVGVHPDYRRRGIARRLMQASMDAIQARGGRVAILQVDLSNTGARRLYEQLGFVNERGWVTWRRSSAHRVPLPLDNQHVHITHRRPQEWRAEYALAQQVRPAEAGGLGWQRPLTIDEFRKPWLKQMVSWFNLQSRERLVIRSDDETRLLAALWIEGGLFAVATQLTLLVAPEYRGVYDAVLLHTACRRLGSNQTLVLEHPEDEQRTADVLRDYQFRPQRQVMHMRWDVP
jgi:ribosomal protein S18 acetylase RimI-like enzyme